MSRLAFALSSLALGACAPTGGSGRDAGALPTIEVRGRVVDFESCSVACRGVEGLVVAWGGAPDVLQSEPTTSEGAFALVGVPSGLRSDLHVLPDGPSSALYSPTLNAMVIAADDVDDVFGLTVYVVNRDPESLLAAVREEASVDLERDGGYIGQVAESSSAGGLVASPGVSVAQAPPQGDVRFVNVLPRRAPAEPALLPPGTTETSTFGLFVVPADPGGEDPVVFQPFDEGANYELVVTPLVPGMVSFGVHLRRL